jgi:hypothetical protein
MESALLIDEIYGQPFSITGSVVCGDGWMSYNPNARNPSNIIFGDIRFNIGTTNLIIPQTFIFNTAGTGSEAFSDYYDELASKRSNYYLTRLIRENGIKRLNIFQNTKEGWDNGKGKSLNRASLQTLDSFAFSFSNVRLENVSLFMTGKGYLSILLRDINKKVVELEFHEDGIEYFIEGIGEEGEVDSQHIDELAERIKLLLACNSTSNHLSA